MNNITTHTFTCSCYSGLCQVFHGTAEVYVPQKVYRWSLPVLKCSENARDRAAKGGGVGGGAPLVCVVVRAKKLSLDSTIQTIQTTINKYK